MYPTVYFPHTNNFQLANKRAFQQDDHWDLRKEESSEAMTDKLSAEFEKVKAKKNPLIRAIFTANRGENFC